MLFYRYDSSNDDNYTQAGLLYRNVLPKDEQIRLVENITDNLKHAADFLQVPTFFISLILNINVYYYNIVYFMFYYF